MSNFRIKLFGLAGFAICTGMAYGQATCAQGVIFANLVRSEGTTESVATPATAVPLAVQPVVGAAFTPGAGDAIACTSTASVAGSINVQVFASAPVTSKVVTTATGATEAAIVIVNATTGFVVAQTGGLPYVLGTVSGSTINFPTVTVPTAAGGFTMWIENVRVNASTITVGTGAPPPVTLSVFISGAAAVVNPAAIAAANVAFVENGLGTQKIYNTYTAGAGAVAAGAWTAAAPASTQAGTNNFVICTAVNESTVAAANIAAAGTLVGANGLAFNVVVNENFPTAFRAQTVAQPHESSAVTVPAGSVAPASTNNVPNSGTRVQLAFANVPANVTLYVPVGTLASTGASGAQLTYTTSATGTFTAGTASTGASTFGSLSGFLAPVAISGGAGTAVFEVTTDDLVNLDTFDIPVFVVDTANTVAGSATGITVTTSFAPVGSTNIPNFVVGASTSTLSGSTFSLCQTSLLFPFVTNQLGFDTGLSIANTSTDPFGAKLGATPQAGTCTLNFYGNGAPTPSSVTGPNVPTGTNYTLTLSSVAPGFQGYLIAVCQFQFGHGYAFLTNGATSGNAAVSQGYLAGVIPNGLGGARAAGAGEGLGQ